MKRAKLWLSLALICTLFGFFSNKTHAVGNSFSISPLKFYPSVAPGFEYSDKLQLYNGSDSELNISLYPELFKTTDENYNYSFKEVGDLNWIKFDESEILLKSKELKVINFTISAPIDAKPGGYYFSIFASTLERPVPGSFTEIKRLSSLVYLEIAGQIKHQASILSIDIPWLTTKSNTSTKVRLSNDGTTHERLLLELDYGYWPSGPSKTKNIEGLVLPATIRKIDSTIDLPALPGIYKIKAKFSPPQGGIYEFSKTIIYLPLWFIFIVSICLIYLIANKKRSKKN